MFKGVWKRLLRVDLTDGNIQSEDIKENLFEKYIGGSGLASKYLYEEVPPNTPALEKENKLIFATGPFQGSSMSGSAKWSVVSRSPLTSTFAVSAAGASWGLQFKKTGFDLLVIEGKSKDPVFLWITDEGIEIESAENIWGKDAIETVELVQDRLDEPKASVATIGPAGEKLVGSACITADKHSFAGRTGLGAVMGSKGLKAIAVKGNRSTSVAEPDKLKELNKELFPFLYENAKDSIRAHGTAASVSVCEEQGDLPIKNWSQATWPEGAEKISAPRYTEKLNAEAWPCEGCTVACHRKIETEYKGESIKGAGAEYETLGMIGSNCLVDDLDAISKANDLCNRLGLDTISVGSYASFTMESFEKNLISKEDLGGLKPDWGSGEFIINLIDQIGNRKDFGSIFEKGFQSAVSKLGKETKELTNEVKNLALPAHDPRTYFSLAINYATSTRGACHLRGYPHFGELGALLLPEIGIDSSPERFNMEGQARLAAAFQNLATLQDSLVICIFQSSAGLELKHLLDLVNSITGFSYSPRELMNVGERTFNLQRMINVNDGINRSDDRLPSRMFQPGTEGKRKGQVPEPFEKTLLDYYEYRGWDNNGIPKSIEPSH